MTAGAWLFTATGRTSLIDGTFDIDSDSYKCCLLTSSSNISSGSTTYAGLTGEVANANGYTTGGIAVAFALTGTTTVKATFTSNPVWTASGGSIVARYAAVYEVGGRVLCYALLDSSPADVTATTGNTLTIAPNASGIFTLA